MFYVCLCCILLQLQRKEMYWSKLHSLGFKVMCCVFLPCRSKNTKDRKAAGPLRGRGKGRQRLKCFSNLTFLSVHIVMFTAIWHVDLTKPVLFTMSDYFWWICILIHFPHTHLLDDESHWTEKLAHTDWPCQRFMQRIHSTRTRTIIALHLTHSS